MDGSNPLRNALDESIADSTANSIPMPLKGSEAKAASPNEIQLSPCIVS